MSGKRMPIEVSLAGGGKHWTKAEIEERRKREASVEKPKKLKAPKWLGKEAKRLFDGYGKLLVENLPVGELDVGTLARMCDAEASYGLAVQKRDAAFEADDLEAYAFWVKACASFEKTASRAASELGCTISSRCRMIVPKTTDEEADPLTLLMEGRKIV